MLRVFMCAPKYYDVIYQINPWMTLETPVKNQLAHTQWKNLKNTIQKCGAQIDLIEPQPNLPDMVFTANAGLIYDKKFYPSHFHYPERQGEREHFIKWFQDQGFQIIENDFSKRTFFEGAGDALFAGKKLFAAYGFRSQPEIYNDIAKLGNINVILCELVDSYFYHLDTCFCPLNDKQALIWPKAFSAASLRKIEQEIELIAVPEADAKRFACNAVVLNNQVIIPSECATTRKSLEQQHFTVHECDMSEYIKAGGACKCLTLIIET